MINFYTFLGTHGGFLLVDGGCVYFGDVVCCGGSGGILTLALD